MEGLLQCSANFIPLTPIRFLERAAIVCGDKDSMVYGSWRTSWRETHERCIKLASALVHLGISRGDVVVAFAPNVPALYELHFGVPMAGGILSALNTRLDAAMLALLLEQLEAKLIFVYYEFLDVANKALNILSGNVSKLPQLVLIAGYDQTSTPNVNDALAGSLEYNSLIAMGKSDFEPIQPENECDPISVNYTSGSTGIPKGAIYSHRAAYLNSIATMFRYDMRRTVVFLWTVDMFRCNGWCCAWAVAALGGTNIFLGTGLTGKLIFNAIVTHKATHLCGAPTILKTIADAPANDQRLLLSKVEVIVAGTLPVAQVLEKVGDLGFNVSQGYGMTEALGPAIVASLQDPTDFDEQMKTTKRREGNYNLMMDGVDVKDPNTMKSVPNDGKTIGEVMFKGNTLMSGYLKKAKATQEAFRGGWYRTGDLAVKDTNGCIEMKDRGEDIIKASGEQLISTLEIERVLVGHPNVLEAAVVGRERDDHQGETPCAFVKLNEEARSACMEKEIIDFCGDRLPSFMVPHSVTFGDLPINSTGKIHKFVLREKIKAVAPLAFQNDHGRQQL